MPLELDNRTPFQCAFPPLLAKNGANILRLMARATYDIGPGGKLGLATEQAPIRFDDEYWGEEGKSSLRYESDVSLERPHTDLLVNGHAHAPLGRPVTGVDVGLSYQHRLIKTMRVFGDRRWDYGAFGWRPTPVLPFLTIPVTYDRAFGGLDDEGCEPRNRVGTGYISKLVPEFAGTPVPNVESLDALIGTPRDRPPPMGLGVVSRDWRQRLRFAGTYDQAWLDHRMPLLPDDFDPRFNQSGPQEQWIPQPTGGELIQIAGMTREGSLSVRLPPGRLRLGLHYTKRTLAATMALETILVDCERRQVELTWRHSVDVHGDPFQLQTMVVSADSIELTPPVLRS